MELKYDDNNSTSILGEYIHPYFHNEIVVVCIGTDKCIGDCLGPLVGTMLKNKKFPFHIYGTLKNPIHAINIKERIDYIKKKHPFGFIIAIDACLGEKNDVGKIQIRNKPIYPGKGVGKKLPSIGDISIIGIVDISQGFTGFSLHNVRLSLIMDMAEVIADSLVYAYKK